MTPCTRMPTVRCVRAKEGREGKHEPACPEGTTVNVFPACPDLIQRVVRPNDNFFFLNGKERMDCGTLSEGVSYHPSSRIPHPSRPAAAVSYINGALLVFVDT